MVYAVLTPLPGSDNLGVNGAVGGLDSETSTGLLVSLPTTSVPLPTFEIRCSIPQVPTRREPSELCYTLFMPTPGSGTRGGLGISANLGSGGGVGLLLSCFAIWSPPAVVTVYYRIPQVHPPRESPD